MAIYLKILQNHETEIKKEIYVNTDRFPSEVVLRDDFIAKSR